jgi:hypothetical protein
MTSFYDHTRVTHLARQFSKLLETMNEEIANALVRQMHHDEERSINGFIELLNQLG